jgi:hypothetical protein
MTADTVQKAALRFIARFLFLMNLKKYEKQPTEAPIPKPAII